MSTERARFQQDTDAAIDAAENVAAETRKLAEAWNLTGPNVRAAVDAPDMFLGREGAALRVSFADIFGLVGGTDVDSAIRAVVEAAVKYKLGVMKPAEADEEGADRMRAEENIRE